MKDRHGNIYGWGVAQYSTPEEMFGYEAVTEAYKRNPQKSKELLLDHLTEILPDIANDKLLRLIK